MLCFFGHEKNGTWEWYIELAVFLDAGQSNSNVVGRHSLQIYLPGTSFVDLSLRTPRLHLVGLDLSPSLSSIDEAEVCRPGVCFELLKTVRHPRS